MSSLSLKAKVLVTVAALGTAAGVAGLGTFGTFTDTTNASTPVDSGIVDINLGAVGAANRLTVAATDIVPGDTMQRAFTLTNASTDPLASVTLTSVASTSSLLDTDATNGLQVEIKKCAGVGGGYVEAGISPAFTYTCPVLSTETTVLASRAVIGNAVALSGLESQSSATGTDSLKMTLSFPSVAGNTLQDKTSVIAFTFTGTQRAATNK